MSPRNHMITKHTKIVCTMGPASSSLPVLEQMIASGMNIARVNFSHGTHADNAQLVASVRKASKAVGQPVAVLLDLQGPKIRIGEVSAEGILLTEGESVVLEAGLTKSDNQIIPVPYMELARSVKKGSRVLLDDGTKELEVTRVKGNTITGKVLLGGVLLSRKGITVPGVSLVEKAITKKDEEDLAFGLQHRMDFVAMSFVRQAEDVKLLKKKIQKYLPKNMPMPAIIAKIEKQEALENFDEILQEVDGVMIARGDLGLETPISQVPIHQKMIIKKCMASHKPMITATEMLGSMQYNPRPTRAEVSDVANAVFDRSDAVMLSGETAMGKHPIRVVQMMSEIIRNTETAQAEDPYVAKVFADDHEDVVIANTAVTLAQNIQAKALVVLTETGHLVRMISSLRPHIPIFVITDVPHIHTQLIIHRGVTPILVDELKDILKSPEKIIRGALDSRIVLKKHDQIVMLSDVEPRTNAIQII